MFLNVRTLDYDGISRQTIINLDNVETIMPINYSGEERMTIRMVSGNTLTVVGSYYKLARQLEIVSFRSTDDD